MKKPRLPHTFMKRPKNAKKVFQGKRFGIYQWKQKMFDGSTATFEVAKRNNSVVIIPIIGDKVVVVKERQPHWEREGITTVAGAMEEGENIVRAARRELEEET